MHPTGPLLRLVTLEVERKFKCAWNILSLLQKNTTPPPIPNLTYRGQKSFKDIYYEFPNDLLSTRGIWVRQRNDVWQAKIRQGGDFANSQFTELTGTCAVEEMLRRHRFGNDCFHERARNFGMNEIAEFGTLRKAWRAGEGGKFEIVVDTTDFDHVVGEVEMQVDVEEWEAEGSELRMQMDGEIKSFMKMYPWAFPEGEAVGKLNAWFAMKEEKARGWKQMTWGKRWGSGACGL